MPTAGELGGRGLLPGRDFRDPGNSRSAWRLENSMSECFKGVRATSESDGRSAGLKSRSEWPCRRWRFVASTPEGETAHSWSRGRKAARSSLDTSPYSVSLSVCPGCGGPLVSDHTQGSVRTPCPRLTRGKCDDIMNNFAGPRIVFWRGATAPKVNRKTGTRVSKQTPRTVFARWKFFVN
jgi:hypothetical protein